jgi:hypothetical protein
MDDTIETDEEIEAQRGWGLFVLFCVTKFGSHIGQAREDARALWGEHGTVAAFFASDDWNFPPGLKQKWHRFLAQHEGSSADDVDAELWAIDAATPRM